MVIPWGQVTQLGVGGLLAIIILWMVFRFLDKKRNGTEKILLKMDASEARMASAIEAVAKSFNTQTHLLEKMYEKQETMHDNIKEHVIYKN